MNRFRRGLLATIAAFAAGRAGAASAPAFLADYERRTRGRIGVYAKNLANGAALEWRADERFVMCSTFKASLAALVLARTERGEEGLAERLAYGAPDLIDYAPVAQAHLAEGSMTIAAMCEAMLEVSDNTCANLLLARVGGPAALTAFWRSIGDASSRLDHYEPELNRSPPGDPRDTTTPAAMAGNLRRLLLEDALSPLGRKRLVGWMLNCKTGGDRLRAGLPAGRRIAHRTGNNGRDAAGDIGIVWDDGGKATVVCVYTQGGEPSEVELAGAFAGAGKVAAGL